MKLLLSLLSVATSVYGVVRWNELGQYSFDQFAKDFGKDYKHDSPEYHKRRALFNDNLHLVTQHNEVGRHYKLGINFFSDMTEPEFAAYKFRQPHHEIKHLVPSAADEMRWLQKSVEHATPKKVFGQSKRNQKMRLRALSPQAEPIKGTDFEWQTNLDAEQTWEATQDWSEKYNSEPVMQNGGSCWAHASVAALEAHAHLRGLTDSPATPVRFSVQEILSCSPNPHHCGGDGACAGSIVELAYDYVKKNGLHTAAEYPFPDADSCSPDELVGVTSVATTCGGQAKAGTKFTIANYTNLPQNKYAPVMAALQQGPVPVAISTDGFRHYEGGVLPCNNKDAVIGHAVLLVGYGEENGQKYWKVRNSWGTSWGENGYVRMLRRDDEESHCGVDKSPALGTGCDGGPSEVPVCGACGILFDAVRLDDVSKL